jgi:hypothetical protein
MSESGLPGNRRCQQGFFVVVELSLVAADDSHIDMSLVVARCWRCFALEGGADHLGPIRLLRVSR